MSFAIVFRYFERLYLPISFCGKTEIPCVSKKLDFANRFLFEYYIEISIYMLYNKLKWFNRNSNRLIY